MTAACSDSMRGTATEGAVGKNWEEGGTQDGSIEFCKSSGAAVGSDCDSLGDVGCDGAAAESVCCAE